MKISSSNTCLKTPNMKTKWKKKIKGSYSILNIPISVLLLSLLLLLLWVTWPCFSGLVLIRALAIHHNPNLIQTSWTEVFQSIILMPQGFFYGPFGFHFSYQVSHDLTVKSIVLWTYMKNSRVSILIWYISYNSFHLYLKFIDF